MVCGSKHNNISNDLCNDFFYLSIDQIFYETVKTYGANKL